MEAILRRGIGAISRASSGVTQKSAVDELCEWGYDLAQKNGLTKEDSRELLREARKILDEKGYIC